MCPILSPVAVTVSRMAIDTSSTAHGGRMSRCPVCCEHGVSNEAWCEWCEEMLEFGTSEYVVTEVDLALPCAHAERSKAS
jgi:hypothetical protein